MNLKKRSYTAELLDDDNIPQIHLFQNLRELSFINRYLGGHRVVLKGVEAFKNNSPKFVAELGSGGGDNLNAIQQKYPDIALLGIDLKTDCIDFAKEHTEAIAFEASDYRQYRFSPMPDVLFNSLFCHHFSDQQLVEMLIFMKQNARVGFFIADLHRHWLAYYAIKWLTRLFSKSYLVKNDAPLSVARGFKKSELCTILEQAGIKNYKIQWQWAFRYLIVVKNE